MSSDSDSDNLALSSAPSTDQVDGVRATGTNPAFSDDAYEAINAILESVESHEHRGRESYQIGVAHAMCIRARVAPDHYLLGVCGQKTSLKDVIAFAEEWIARKQRMDRRANATSPPSETAEKSAKTK